jgi:hypothetical protein
MNTDHYLWERVCQEYIEMYKLIIKKMKAKKEKCYCNNFRWWQGSRLYPLTETRSKPAVPHRKI